MAINVDELEAQFNEQQYQQHMAEVLATNAQRRAANPTFRQVDPTQPALSEQAEVIRQAQAQDKANQAEFRNAPAYEPLSLDELEAQYQASLKQEQAPPTKPYVAPEASLNPQGFQPEESPMSKTLGPVIKAIPGLETGLDYLAMPGDYLRGLIKGQPGERVDPYTFAGVDDQTTREQAAIRGGFGMMVDPLIGLGAVGGLLRGARAIPKGPSIPPVVSEVDPSLIGKVTPSATGIPDYPTPGPRVDETGRTLTVPALDPGTMTAMQQAISARTGRPLKGQVPGLSPGEYGPEEQTALLSEPPSGMSPTTGKRIVEPGEQLAAGEVPLRPQVVRKPGIPTGKPLPTDPKSGIAQTEYPGLSPSVKEGEITAFSEKFLRETLGKKQDIIKNYAPQTDYRLKLQTSPRGSVSVREAERDSGFRYTRDPMIPPDAPLYFPGWPSRTTQSIVDTFRQMGPRAANIGNAIDQVLSNRAVLSSNDLINTMESLKPIVATRGRFRKTIEGFRELTQGENAFVWGTHRYLDLTEGEVEQAWNYLYTNGRMVPASTKARAVADKVYEGLLHGPSVHAHEAGLQGYNPLTGKHYDLGDPHMFMPQIPVHSSTLKNISDVHLELLYKHQGGLDGTGKSFPMWKAQLNRILSQGGELREAKAAGASMDDAAATYDMASKRYKGLEVARMLDLEKLGEITGKTPWQLAKELGYETDLIRAAFKFNSSAYMRTEWARAMPLIEREMGYLAEHSGTDLTEWATKAVERAQGINTGITETAILRNLVRGVRDFNNATLLQLGGIGSFPQLGYALSRARYIDSLLGAVDFVTGSKQHKALVERSGSVYPTVMNMMLQPEGALATLSTGAHRVYGVTLLDKWSRYNAGLIGARHVDFLEKALLKYPNKERLHKLVDEIGGDPKVILQEGKIPENMKLAMIQKFANYSAGIPDARGLPLIATNETAYWRLANQYRVFMFNNQAELIRVWKQAPTLPDAVNRVSKILLGTGTSAAMSGALTEYIRNAFIDDPEGSKFVNKRLKKIVGDEGAAFAIQTLIYGLGTVAGSVLLTTLDNQWKAVGGLTLGPTGSLIHDIAEDIVDTVTGGPSAKSLRATSRRVPFVGPMLAPAVRDQVKQDQERAREEERLMRSLMPQGAFQNEP